MMINKLNRFRHMIALLAVLAVAVAVPIYARDHAARLKECLQTDYMYYACSIATLNHEQRTNKEAFRNNYDDRHIVLSGLVTVNSISGNQTEITVKDENNNLCTVVTSASDMKQIVAGMSVGEQVTVYGMLNVTGWLSDSYQIIARKLTAKASNQFTPGSYVFYADETYNAAPVKSLTAADTVEYSIPAAWDNEYVSAKLTNNGVSGYQYFLNAIAPQNTEYPEIFSIFYFDYETYLEKVPVDPTAGDKKDIEEAIIRNILQNQDSNFRISVETVKDANNGKLDYYSTTYRPKDGRDYRLEFLFKSGKKGIVCMLYLYYPTEAAVKHVREVAYLIETMRVG